MTTHALLVDDNEVDLRHAARLTRDGLVCSPFVPPPTHEDLRQEVQRLYKNGGCDVLLLDYRLDAETVGDGGRRNYRGGSVAALVKEHLPDLPIVLVTTEQKFRSNLQKKPQVQALFDHTILKQRIASRAERPQVVTELVELGQGFRQIRETDGTGWQRLAKLLKTRDDTDSLQELSIASPPSGTSAVAQWVLHELFPYPGLLVGEAQAAASLGISIGAMRRSELRDALKECRYEGVFARFGERWWKGCLQRWLTSFAGDDGVSGSERSTQIAEHLGLSGRIVRGATCVWCRGKDVIQTCARCVEPVDPQHSIPVVVDDRPPWADRATVCFSCIRSGRIADAQVLSGSETVVRAIQTGKLSPEGENGR